MRMTNGTGRIFVGFGTARGAGAAQVLRGAGLAVAAAGALAAGPAAALMPPYVYENARRDAASVIVLEVKAVTPPGGGYGNCGVDGVVRAVERGTAFKPGDAVRIGVPCVEPGAQPPLGGTMYQAVGTLSASKYGRAWLGPDGQVVFSQYQQLQELP